MLAELATLLSLVGAAPGAGEHPTRHAHHHRGCRTFRCDRRMARRAHRRTVRRWRAVARPYAGWLAKVRQCESGGRYGISTGNGFHGAYQFTLSSWCAVGGKGYPHHASPAEQDFRAVRLLKLQGPRSVAGVRMTRSTAAPRAPAANANSSRNTSLPHWPRRLPQPRPVRPQQGRLPQRRRRPLADQTHRATEPLGRDRTRPRPRPAAATSPSSRSGATGPGGTAPFPPTS